MPWQLPVTEPAWLAPYGYEIRGCRRYREGAARYNYQLLDPQGDVVALQVHGKRRLLSFNFPTPWGRQKRIDLHRLVAFNHPAVNTAPRRHFDPDIHVHHKPHPVRRRSPPWHNCLLNNLQLLTKEEHRRWHHENPDVPWWPF